MSDFKKEYIACSAIWYDDGCSYLHQPKNIDRGFVVTGMRHCNCFSTVYILRGKKLNVKSIQGFLTSHNKFKNRTDAVEIAYRSGQIGEIKKELFSEDVF